MPDKPKTDDAPKLPPEPAVEIATIAQGERRKVAPGEDRRVRHPDGRLLEGKGETVAWSTYWQRRLDDEDIILVSKKGS